MSVYRFNRREEKNHAIMSTIHSWWAQHSGVKIPDILFSDFGFLALVDDKPVMASFFYPLMGTDLCLWGYQVTNPDSSFDERTQAIDEVATAMSEFGKQLGYKMMIAYPGNKAIVKRLHDVGFKMGDVTVTQAFKELV